LKKYFDSAYIAKCYLAERDSEQVRSLAQAATAVSSSMICIAELACVFHRQIREASAPPEWIAEIRAQFQEDLANRVWNLLPVSPSILRSVDSLVARLPASLFIRAGDAVHLATAIENGFDEIWTNDRRLLAAADAAGVRGRCLP
jgi:predicted nucleic acid-binding protein